MKRSSVVWIIGLGSGLAVWCGIALIAQRREAWDSEYYFKFGFPLLILISGILGYAEPSRAWRWGVAVFALQPLALFGAHGCEAGPLAPVGCLFFVIMSLPAIGSAYVGALFGRRKRIPAGHCQRCGYNLTGNPSGRCPECGESVS